MKIQHDLESFSIVLDDGTESDVVEFGSTLTLASGGNVYFACLESPTESGLDGIKPVVYKLTSQPTVMEEVDFDDEDEEEGDEEDEDEEETVERSAPEQL